MVKKSPIPGVVPLPNSHFFMADKWGGDPNYLILTSKQAGPLRSHSGISLDGLALVRQGRVDVAEGGKLGSYAAELQGA